MLAVRVHDWGGELVVEEVPVPVPREGEALVRVEAAALSHLDRTVATGGFGLRPQPPYVCGVEGAGIVEHSATVPAGTRVLLRAGGLGLIRDGTWAEYVTVPDRHLDVLPDDLPADLGATYFLPLTTAHTALGPVGRLGEWGMDHVESAADEVVVVTGAVGAVGSMAVQLARRAGASVLGVVLDNTQAADLLPGVEPVLASDHEQSRTFLTDRPATLLVDTLGGASLRERSGWVRAGGRAVSIGYVAGAALELNLPDWLLQDVALLPVNMIRRDHEARAVAADLAPLLANGELRLNVERFGLEDAPRALDLLGSGKLRGRGVLVPKETR